MTNDGKVAGQFWVEHAQKHAGTPMAIHMRERFGWYHEWTRGLLQRWTLARMRGVRRPFRRAVDLGCGYGDWTAQFGTLSDEVHGCEISPTFVELARERLASHPHAEIECSSLLDYRIPRGADFVYAGATFMYLPDEDVITMFHRIRDAIAPGALVIVRDWCAFNIGQPSDNRRPGFYSTHRDPRQLIDFAHDAGLHCVEARSAPSIYGEVLGGRFLQWPLRGLWRLISLPWLRTSFSLIFRA